MAEAPAVAKPAAGATRDAETTRAACAPGVAGFEVLAEQVQDLAREHHLPKAFVEKTLVSLRDALRAGPALAQLLIDRILADVRTRVLRNRRGPRAPYATLERQRLVAILARSPGMPTSGIAREAEVSRQVAHRSLAALAKRGLVARHAKERDLRRGWYVTKAGVDLLNSLPEVKHGRAKGYAEILVLIEKRIRLREELVNGRMNWTYDMARDVLPFHAVSYIERTIREVVSLEKRGLVWSPSGVIWFRLGTEPREMKKARRFAATLPPGARAAYVEAKREEAKREVFERRRQGIARLHLPAGLAEAFLAATKKEPFYIAALLAFSLRKMAKKGLTVTLGDLNGVLHEIRKKVLLRQRLPLDEDGEPHGGAQRATSAAPP